MRSAHGEVFSHDDEADGYDAEVRNEKDPIRAAYSNVLEWVVKEARIISTSRVLELGSGTGNLSSRIPRCSELVCVDLSERMEAIARKKLAHIPNRRFIKADILEVFEHENRPFDSVISTYTLHHLADDEKRILFAKVFASLVPGGRAVFGDLMVQNKEEEALKIQQYLANGDAKTAGDLREEFFWSIDAAVIALCELGFRIKIRRFSDLSCGIVAEKAN
ncbi:MAG: class I SAM-dependent methyltransferase [Chthoniobacterales bacterium]